MKLIQSFNSFFHRSGAILSGIMLFALCMTAGCQSNKNPDSDITFTLSNEQLPDYETNIDHAGLIEELDEDAFERGMEIYTSVCYNCHGNPEHDGSLPTAHKFWRDEFKVKNDPFSMYQVLTRGYGTMPPQLQLVPLEKYDVIHFIRENFIREENPDQYFAVNDDYLEKLPQGESEGPEPVEKRPWAEMDYGDFLINTYELAGKNTPLRNMSDGEAPLKDEDFSYANFAYKGIAVRLDEGKGGVSAGKSWMIFDHDLLRVAGGWSGEGFIDWDGILFNGRHNISPRTIGDLHFSNPVAPGWADPATGSFDDPRFTARDGRKFGPLPHNWARFKGIYHHEQKVIISYHVGEADILELLDVEYNSRPVYTRNLHITNASGKLKMHVASNHAGVVLKGEGARLIKEKGQTFLLISGTGERILKLLIAESPDGLEEYSQNSAKPIPLIQYTSGGLPHYPEVLTTSINPGKTGGPFEVDFLTSPTTNKWNSRLRMSGIDFFADKNKAVVCCTEGDVWIIEGLTDGKGELSWRRIASGLFQPLGVKVVDERIYVTCRDQLVRLNDLNGDGETDFYESFNNDHQVTDHFHEFAMGLQTDKEGNFYYAKGARHAREGLVPQHGTLIKVSKDGSTSEIMATGLRASNGVCINPDGSFIVTDQEGHWNPMNRINWIDQKGFYGNMFAHNPPKDSSDQGMVQPLAWVDAELDRSPSELVWVNSDEWGPLNGSLLDLSYGYGTVLLVPHESVNAQMQGGVFQLPIPAFQTGVMRGRFNPADGQLYACGMSAWGTQQMYQAGALYRIKYSGKPVHAPVELNAIQSGIRIRFSDKLDRKSVGEVSNFAVKTWDLKRSREYGSDHYNEMPLTISSVKLAADEQTILISIPGIKPVWQMEIAYSIKDKNGKEVKGVIQNTIHNLGEDPSPNM
ncbi:c-type cytochrome [Fulvivirgaceae bacterium BMA12]|uniref:C-type cytochrome n=1 Tax=Agaribacillus aureus TaxID=3051825 RepID=A0ABT8LGA6_9BACT|nr:c-type cytochrome [Fulvivirgaceae bacterium BMA12]